MEFGYPNIYGLSIEFLELDGGVYPNSKNSMEWSSNPSTVSTGCKGVESRNGCGCEVMRSCIFIYVVDPGICLTV